MALMTAFLLFASLYFFYHRNVVQQLKARVNGLEAELEKTKDDYETAIALQKARESENSCSKLEGQALSDFMAKMPPHVVKGFIAETRKQTAMFKGYELPGKCAEMLPPECFNRQKKNSSTAARQTLDSQQENRSKTDENQPQATDK